VCVFNYLQLLQVLAFLAPFWVVMIMTTIVKSSDWLSSTIVLTYDLHLLCLAEYFEEMVLQAMFYSVEKLSYRILMLRSQMIGMSERTLMIQMTQNLKTGTSQSTFQIQMQRNQMTGMMRWMENGSHQWSTIQNTRYTVVTVAHIHCIILYISPTYSHLPYRFVAVVLIFWLHDVHEDEILSMLCILC